MTCGTCGHEQSFFQKMARLTDAELACRQPDCGGRNDMALTHRITGAESFLDRTLAEFDVPPLDIVRAANGERELFLELTGDKAQFFSFR
jgi:hypothetical protein